MRDTLRDPMREIVLALPIRLAWGAAPAACGGAPVLRD
jgi:hypothetical protein